jgi:hypothetical protein
MGESFTNLMAEILAMRRIADDIGKKLTHTFNQAN